MNEISLKQQLKIPSKDEIIKMLKYFILGSVFDISKIISVYIAEKYLSLLYFFGTLSIS